MGLIYLLRHGQTAWNKGMIFRGRHDIPLDEHGLAQAKCAGGALGKLPLAAIYSSPLSRTMQTADPVAVGQGLAVRTVAELTDIDYGDWTGKNQQEVEKLYPQLSRQWRECPEKVRFPQGESLGDVRDRAFGKLTQLAQQDPEQVVLVVSHRVVLKVLICAALEMPLGRFWQVQVDTASLSVLAYRQDKFTLQSLNDTCHLRSLQGGGDAGDF